MKIEYFPDTDTLLIEFSDQAIVESRDLNENALIEFDATGKVVSMTLEHAGKQANLTEFIFHTGRGMAHEEPVGMVAEEPPEYKTKRDEL